MTEFIAELRHTTPDGVIRADELRAAGVSNHAVSVRCRPSGPWRRVLPGVVLMTTGPPSRRQRLRAAVAYAGGVVSGADAMRAQGIRVHCPGEVLVLLPADRRAVSRSYVTVERTTRLPDPIWLDGLPMAPVARATIDAARREHDLDRLRSLLVAPLDAGACTVAELLGELAAGNQRGSAAPRAMLARLDPHQYSSGSLPSISRTWLRAQSGQSQTWPRGPFSTTHASAKIGGISARDRPHREQRTSG
jgi:hypothetical protein